jgi:hypothetical protein
VKNFNTTFYLPPQQVVLCPVTFLVAMLANQLCSTKGLELRSSISLLMMNTGMIPNREAATGVVESILLGRLCTLEEVANAVQMFVTTSFATGQVWDISSLVAGLMTCYSRVDS